jgi:predicted metalloendopeptidase
MAKAAMEIVKRRDPKNLDHEMSLDAVQKLTPSFNFNRYLQLIHASTTGTFIVTSPDFFRGTEQLIQSESLDHWKAYLRWHLLDGLAGAMSDDFVNEDFAFGPQTCLVRNNLCRCGVDAFRRKIAISDKR